MIGRPRRIGRHGRTTNGRDCYKKSGRSRRIGQRGFLTEEKEKKGKRPQTQTRLKCPPPPIFYTLQLSSGCFSHSFSIFFISLPICFPRFSIQAASHVIKRGIKQSITSGKLFFIFSAMSRAAAALAFREPHFKPVTVSTFFGKLIADLDSPVPQGGQLCEVSHLSCRDPGAKDASEGVRLKTLHLLVLPICQH